ncbi:MAG TPA: hypothetical protein VGM75_33920 [Pseudonocardiaceae bacterium]|jgi:hypothetical protein
MTTTLSTPTARPYTEADRADVLNLFTQPDFFYRCQYPDTLSEKDIRALLGDDTHVVCADGAVIGLYALELISSDNGCNYQLHLRCAAQVSDDEWQSLYHEVVRAVRERTEIVRLTQIFAEFDERGLRNARALDLTEEGTLAGVLARDGRRYGKVYFARIWAVRP